jgi:hypothetical protein
MQRRELSFKLTGQLKTELETASQQSGRGLKTQVRFYLQAVLRVAQRQRGLWFADIQAEVLDRSSQGETHKADLPEEEASFLKELANEYGWSVSKLVRVLLRTALGLQKEVAPERGLIGKEELIALILLELGIRSSKIQ